MFLYRADRARPGHGTSDLVAREATPAALARFVARQARVSRIVIARLDDCRALGAMPERDWAVMRAWLDDLRWR